MKYQYPAKSKSKLGGVDECVEVFSDLPSLAFGEVRVVNKKLKVGE